MSRPCYCWVAKRARINNDGRINRESNFLSKLYTKIVNHFTYQLARSCSTFINTVGLKRATTTRVVINKQDIFVFCDMIFEVLTNSLSSIRVYYYYKVWSEVRMLLFEVLKT